MTEPQHESAGHSVGRWLLLALGVLLASIVAGVAFLVGTNTGAKWAFARARAALEDPLSAQSIEGSIAGALTLTGLHFGNDTSPLEIKAGRIALNLAFADLLRWRVHLQSTAIERFELAMRPRPQEEPQHSKPFSLQPPIDVVLDDFILAQAVIRQDGEPLADIERLEFSASWTGAGLAIGRLDLKAKQGTATLHGDLRYEQVYAGRVQGEFQWRTQESTIAGSLQASTSGAELHSTVKLARPTTATLALTLVQNEQLPWSFELQVPTFDPSELSSGSSFTAMSAGLQGKGTRLGGSVRGQIMLNGEPLELRALEVALHDQRIEVDLEALVANSAGAVRAAGELQLTQTPWQADFDVRWNELHLPAAWAGQQLDTHGELAFAGNPEKFTVAGDVSLGPPDRTADLKLDVAGSTAKIQVRQLAVKQQAGDLSVTGELQLQPAMAWDLQAEATSFNPGDFLPAWQGDLSFNLASHGSVVQAGPQGELHLRKLQGKLRDRPLSGSADLTLTPAPVLAGHLELRSGESRVQFRGEQGDTWDAQARIQIASLNDWMPDASGSVSGGFGITGQWPELKIDGKAAAKDIDTSAMQLESASLNTRLENPQALSGAAELEFSGAAMDGFAFESGSLQLDGNLQQHAVKLQATGDPVSVDLALRGERTATGADQRMSENIERLTLELRDAGSFALREPATLTVEGSALTLSPACLVNAEAQLCVSGETQPDGALNAEYSLAQLPLKLIQSVVPTLPVKLSGLLEGKGKLHREASGQWFGSLTLQSSRGELAQPTEVEGQSNTLLRYQNFQVNTTLNGDDARATISAQLDDSGVLDGRLAIAGLSGTQPPLQGRISAEFPDIVVLALLTAQVADTHGRVRLQADLGGTLVKPEIHAQLHASELAAGIPALGLKLHDGVIDAQPRDDEHIGLAGRFQSGDGEISFDGVASYAGEIELDIHGKQFLAADIPGARVVASPALKFILTAERMHLSGEVSIPSAKINVQKLPRSARAQTGSPDVIVVDAKTQEEAEAEKIPLYADIDVILGEDVDITGFGLQAELNGRLAVREAPGQATTGSGEIRVAGTYKAYGQDLTIRQGSILYGSTPLANPTLRIVAVREVNDVTAGLRINGTAQSPELTVFANPTMDDANALSYLVAGRPLDSIGEGDGDALQSAARSLGTAAGGLLSKRLGSRLGIDTVGIEKNELLGGSAFTVGEYLSPRLYLSYGVGLFEPGDVITLRYRLSDEVSLRAERGPSESRAGIEYRVEK